jgi:hypothetical protein
MRIPYKRAVCLFVLGLSIALTPAVLASPDENSGGETPKEIVSCLPHTIVETRTLGPVAAEGSEYYLVRGKFALRKDAPLLWGHFLVGTDKSGCALLNAPADASTLLQRGLSLYVSEGVARKIALARWKEELRHYPDRAAFEREVRAGLVEGPDRTILAPEDVWALKELGIDLPDAEKGGESP